MRRSKWYVVVFIFLAVIVYVSNGMLNMGKSVEHYSVTVVLEDSGNDRWNAFKEGLEQSAEHKNIYLNIVSTGEFSDLEEECAIIRRELENGTDGLIVEPCGDDGDGAFAELISAGAAVLVGNGLESEKLLPLVAPDQYRLGKAIGEAVTAGEGEGLSDQRIGILAGSQEKLSHRQRLEGVRDALAEAGKTADWILVRPVSGEELFLDGAARPVDVLITLDNRETEEAVDFLLEGNAAGCRIYGEGRSEKAVYYLGKGVIRTLIVANEFYMGYQSAELLAQMLNYYSAETEFGEVDFLTVTEENLYEEEVEKVLFPTVR